MKEKFTLWVDYAYEKSILTDEQKFRAFLDKPDLKKIEQDPIFNFVESLVNFYRTEIAWRELKYETQMADLERMYVEAMREMLPAKTFYPDANSTLRVSFGEIKGGTGLNKTSYSILKDMLAKSTKDSAVYPLPRNFIEATQRQDDSDKILPMDLSLPVCLQSTHDISAGNSGSPLINCDGEIIGLAYDGNWESIASDIQFDPASNRTISVDVRFILFMIRSFSKNDGLIKEVGLSN